MTKRRRTPSLDMPWFVVLGLMASGCGDMSNPAIDGQTDAGSADAGDAERAPVWRSVQDSGFIYALDSVGRVFAWDGRDHQPLDISAPTLAYLPSRGGLELCGLTVEGRRWCQEPRPPGPFDRAILRTLDYNRHFGSPLERYECGILRDEDAAICQWTTRGFYTYRQAAFVDVQVGFIESDNAVALDAEGRMWELDRQGRAILLSNGPYVSITMNSYPCGLGVDNVVRCFDDYTDGVRYIGRLPGEFVSIWSEKQVIYCGHRPTSEFVCYFSGRLDAPYVYENAPPVEFTGEVSELTVGRSWVCAVLTRGALECRGEPGRVPENIPRFPPPVED